MNLKLRKIKTKDMIRFKNIWPIGFFFLISACLKQPITSTSVTKPGGKLPQH